MLTRVRYTSRQVVQWTRYELALLLAYAVLVTLAHVRFDLRVMSLPWPAVAVVGTAVAFMIGFQNNAAYGRIWEARKIWGGIVNASRAFGMQVQDCIETDDPDASAHRRRLIERHIAWLTTLRYAMRQKRTWETNDHHRTNREWSDRLCIPERDEAIEERLRPLLSEAEYDAAMACANPSAALLFEQSRHLAELKRRGWIGEFAFLHVQGVLQRLFDEQGRSERIKNFPYPRQYATLGSLFVGIFTTLVPLAVVPQFEAIGADLALAGTRFSAAFVWMSVPFSMLVSWIFILMERIGRAGENPFEGSPNDVPISTIARGIEIDLRQMLRQEPSSVPEPLAPTLNIQM